MAIEDAFGDAMARMWARDGIVVDDPEALAKRVAKLVASGEAGTREAARLMVRSGVRTQWNHILRHERAAALAGRIRPFVTEPLVDVLSGDGAVCRALCELGLAQIAATERSGQYDESVLPPTVAFRPFPDDFDLLGLPEFSGSTALVSTVLHHEPNPIRLLDALSHTSTWRWIVIENCVTPEFSRPFHQFADRFFNTCLNEFGVDCVEQHRTLDQWADLLSTYGAVEIISDAFTVPGIPFPYSLLLVDRNTH